MLVAVAATAPIAKLLSSLSFFLRLSSATYSPAIRSNKRRHFRGPSKNSRILHLYRGENYNDQSFLWAVIFPVPGKKRPSHHSYDLLDLGHLRVCHERIVRGE